MGVGQAATLKKQASPGPSHPESFSRTAKISRIASVAGQSRANVPTRMPTNRLWLEHTERAAWESVQALRQKLATAEERLQRFAPVKETWQSIVEALDHARNDLNVQKERYSEIAHTLVAELRAARVERDQLAADLEIARSSSPAPAPVSLRHAYDENAAVIEDALSDAGAADDAAKGFRAMWEQYTRDAGALAGKRKLALTRKALERHLEELEELDDSAPAELADQATRIGALALRLLTLSRAEIDKRAARRTEDTDE